MCVYLRIVRHIERELSEKCLNNSISLFLLANTYTWAKESRHVDSFWYFSREILPYITLKSVNSIPSYHHRVYAFTAWKIYKLSDSKLGITVTKYMCVCFVIIIFVHICGTNERRKEELWNGKNAPVNLDNDAKTLIRQQNLLMFMIANCRGRENEIKRNPLTTKVVHLLTLWLSDPVITYQSMLHIAIAYNVAFCCQLRLIERCELQFLITIIRINKDHLFPMKRLLSALSVESTQYIII